MKKCQRESHVFYIHFVILVQNFIEYLNFCDSLKAVKLSCRQLVRQRFVSNTAMMPS